MRPKEVSDALQLESIAKGHIWKVEPSCATTGEGIFEGLVRRLFTIYCDERPATIISLVHIYIYIIFANPVLRSRRRPGYQTTSSFPSRSNGRADVISTFQPKNLIPVVIPSEYQIRVTCLTAKLRHDNTSSPLRLTALYTL